MKFVLTVGAFADPLAKQFKSQGVVVDAKYIDAWQRDLDAIIRLCVRGLLTEAQESRCVRAIMKDIKSKVKQGAMK